jgi:hypothetical protein
MVHISDFTVNHKYYINLQMPFRKDELKLRVIIHELIPKTNQGILDYIMMSTISSSKDIIDECGFNPVTIPLPCIKKVLSLHDILNDIFIDDIIFLINEYV